MRDAAPEWQILSQFATTLLSQLVGPSARATNAALASRRRHSITHLLRPEAARARCGPLGDASLRSGGARERRPIIRRPPIAGLHASRAPLASRLSIDARPRADPDFGCPRPRPPRPDVLDGRAPGRAFGRSDVRRARWAASSDESAASEKRAQSAERKAYSRRTFQLHAQLGSGPDEEPSEAASAAPAKPVNRASERLNEWTSE